MNRIAPFDGLEIGPPFRLPFALTSPFNAPRDYGNGLHEGSDYDILGQPADSVEPVLCGYDGVVFRSENNGTAYGHFVVTKHENHGFPFYLWYCHMDKRFVVPGQVVKRGDPVGELGATGGNWGEHVHVNLQVPGHGLAGYVVPDVVDPHPYIKKTPDQQPGLDLTRFMVADPLAFRVVRMPNGSQEDVQDMQLGNGLYVRRKNQLGEWWQLDNLYFYLIHDTSPDKDSQGNDRVYTLTKQGVPGAPKNPRIMTLGQTWQEQGSHHVQFRARHGCALLSENSGFAQNKATLTDYKTNYTFNSYGQSLTLDEVIWIQTGVETQVYARHSGRAVGWCGWQAPWGQSEITEIHWDRGAMTQEPNRYCSW